MYFFLCIALLFAACNAQAGPDADNGGICKTRNGYYNILGRCDTYYECRDYVAKRKTCPDGLNYNPVAAWPDYPCSYPTDVPCLGRGISRPPQPTAECPRQFGFFALASDESNDCDRYRMCAQGRAYDMICPFGLAFNFATARCDWPDRVPGCNNEDFLGFICPAAEYDEYGYPIVINYRYEGDCKLFFNCQHGRGRVLSCDDGLAFDPSLGHCVNADLVECDEMYELSARSFPDEPESP